MLGSGGCGSLVNFASGQSHPLGGIALDLQALAAAPILFPFIGADLALSTAIDGATFPFWVIWLVARGVQDAIPSHEGPRETPAPSVPDEKPGHLDVRTVTLAEIVSATQAKGAAREWRVGTLDRELSSRHALVELRSGVVSWRVRPDLAASSFPEDLRTELARDEELRLEIARAHTPEDLEKLFVAYPLARERPLRRLGELYLERGEIDLAANALEEAGADDELALVRGIPRGSARIFWDPEQVWCATSEGDILWERKATDLGFEGARFLDRALDLVVCQGASGDATWIFALDMQGEERWRRRLWSPGQSLGPFAIEGSRILLAQEGGALALDARNGSVVWSVTFTVTFDDAGIAHPLELSASNLVSAFDPATGKLR
jgi:hypothetical protein